MITSLHSALNIHKLSTSEPMMKDTVLSPTYSNTLIKNISFIHYSIHIIITEKNHYYRHHNSPDSINEYVTLVPSTINKTNTKDYVFLGICRPPLLSDIGVTLNEEGDLIFIQGQSLILLSGLYNKYRNKKNYTYYAISNKRNITFESLYIDATGELTAKLKNRNIYSSI